MKIISTIAIISLLSCHNDNSDKNEVTQKVETKVSEPLIAFKPQDRPLLSDTLFVGDTLSALFFNSNYNKLFSDTKEYLVDLNIRQVVVDSTYSWLNLNSDSLFDLSGIDRDTKVLLYKKGKDIIEVDQYSLDNVLYTYVNEDDYNRVYSEGRYLTNDFGYAAYSDDIEKLESLILDGASAKENCMYDMHYGYDALYIAIEQQNLKAATFFINNGAEIDRVYTETFHTPLSLVASMANHEKSMELAKLLIERGANVNGTDGGFMPLVSPITNAIISSNADLSMKDGDGSLVLNQIRYISDDNIAAKSTKLLLESGAFRDERELLTEFAVSSRESIAKEVNEYLQSI